MKISYALLAHNEDAEIRRLLTFLLQSKRPEDEIVVLLDEGHTSTQVEEVVHSFQPFLTVCRKPLIREDSQKNFLTDLCTGDYVLQLDADEMLTVELVRELPSLIEAYQFPDVCYLPRKNVVHGIKARQLRRWRWRQNSQGWINWPDYQGRLYRKCEEIRWFDAVHAHLGGATNVVKLPLEEKFAIIHEKNILRQEEQNKTYAKVALTGSYRATSRYKYLSLSIARMAKLIVAKCFR